MTKPKTHDAEDDMITQLLNKESALYVDIEAMKNDFTTIEHLFHWKQNFITGLSYLNHFARKVAQSKPTNAKKIINSNHKIIRFVFHALLQIPYIIHEHFDDKKNEGHILTRNYPTLKKIQIKFGNEKNNRLILLLRHKVVHELLLDEYVTLVEPIGEKHYLEVTLPRLTITHLLDNGKGKSRLGGMNDYFMEVFKGKHMKMGAGFLYLFSGYKNELCAFEKEFRLEHKNIFSDKYKLKHSLLVKLSNTRRKLEKCGLINC